MVELERENRLFEMKNGTINGPDTTPIQQRPEAAKRFEKTSISTRSKVTHTTCQSLAITFRRETAAIVGLFLYVAGRRS